jgi:hypothetical protein
MSHEREKNEALWKPLWSSLSNKIDWELPGEPLWSQAAPVDNGDVSEGLAIRREGVTDLDTGLAAWYLFVYFRLVPVSVDSSGRMVGGESADDWDVEVGYTEPFDTLAEAKDEAGRILADLPTPEYMEERGYDFFLRLLQESSVHD